MSTNPLSLLTPTIFNQISNLFAQLLAAEVQTQSTANCSIAIGTISGSLNSNCNILISNICGAEQNSLVLFDIAFTQIVSLTIPQSQQVDLLSVYNSLRANCVAEAELSQNISVGNITIGTCNASVPLYFNFINSGDAASNCVISGILAGSLESLTVNPTASDPTITFIQDNFIYLAFGLVAVASLVCLYKYTKMMGNKHLVIYRKNPHSKAPVIDDRTIDL